MDKADNIPSKVHSDQISNGQKVLFVIGLVAFLVGVSILSFMGIRKIQRDLHRQKLMQENVVVEIAALNIKAPVLEGTEQAVLREGAGHFSGTGDVGEGNYCIAAHSSTIYKEYFNELKNVQEGMQIQLYRPDKTFVTYTVTEFFVVEPNETWILDEVDDKRITLVTCTDDGTQRFVVVGKLDSQIQNTLS